MEKYWQVAFQSRFKTIYFCGMDGVGGKVVLDCIVRDYMSKVFFLKGLIVCVYCEV